MPSRPKKHRDMECEYHYSKQQNNKQGNKNTSIPPLNEQNIDSFGNCCATDEPNRL